MAPVECFVAAQRKPHFAARGIQRVAHQAVLRQRRVAVVGCEAGVSATQFDSCPFKNTIRMMETYYNRAKYITL